MHITSFRRDAEFGRCRGKADMAGLATSFEGILNQHFQDRLFWVSSAFCGGDFSILIGNIPGSLMELGSTSGFS
jgi:hypothetical protein